MQMIFTIMLPQFLPDVETRAALWNRERGGLVDRSRLIQTVLFIYLEHASYGMASYTMCSSTPASGEFQTGWWSTLVKRIVFGVTQTYIQSPAEPAWPWNILGLSFSPTPLHTQMAVCSTHSLGSELIPSCCVHYKKGHQQVTIFPKGSSCFLFF